MDKLVAIRIKHNDGTYSNEIPLSVLAINIDWDGTHSLVDVLGNVDLNKGSIQEQINALITTITPDNVQYDLTHTLSDVLGDVDLDKGDLQTQIDNISDGEIQVDSTLTAAGKAADAKAVGDNLKNVVRVGNSNVTNFTSIILGDTAEQVNLLDQSDLVNINARLSALENGGIQVDQTLSVQGMAADAKATGDVFNELNDKINYITPEMYGAKGDGSTDDTAAIQSAIDNNYDVYFESNKTYYLASTVTIDHNCKLHGGLNTIIKTKTPSGGIVNNAFNVQGNLKKTTTLTTDYVSNGYTDNSNNRFTLSDMTGIDIGDVMVITATDQYYSYARQYYYLGATLLITDIYNGHIYSCDSMPWDIENTANVSVKIYSAPAVKFENLHFVSDLDSRGHYRYFILLQHCKNSVIRDCYMTQMDNGIHVIECVNTLIDNVSLSKSKWDNSLQGDGYGIQIGSCTNTVLERIMATCAQHSVTISGTIPAINTFVRHCELTSECRAPGLDTHESVYNLVIEDCVLGTACLNGTVTINRCRVINNRRHSDQPQYVSIYGNHNPAWSKYRISNTEFEGTGIIILGSGPQNPIQSYDSVVGEVILENCTGGIVVYEPTTNATILSNTLNELSIKNCKDFSYIMYDGNSAIKKLIVEDSTFTKYLWLSDNNSNHGLITSGIEYLDVKNADPMTHKVSVDKADAFGANYILPKDVGIQLSSNNANAKFVVCGSNLVSDNADDYVVGSVSGPDGGTLSRTKDTSGGASISIDTDGNPVFTQIASSTAKLSFYPVGMFYIKEPGRVELSATLKNTGGTSGASFSPRIAIVDCDTGKIIWRGGADGTIASAEGTEASYTRGVTKRNCVAMGYFYCNSPVSGSETTFENLQVKFVPTFGSAPIEKPYEAKRLTGDGTILSLDGVNNIMSSEANFSVKFIADYVNNPIGLLASGKGVSF